MAYVTGKKVRPLHINFDIYQDSDDLEFRVELIGLMAGSLKDMLASASKSFENGRSDVFRKAVHKSKSTLVLLNDNDLNLAVERFTKQFEINAGALEKDFYRLRDVCGEVVDSLEYEAEMLRQRL